ncbi:MAG: acyltransferase [Marivirga sp.]|nr:acyltransferase [Marivirga sp.]
MSKAYQLIQYNHRENIREKFKLPLSVTFDSISLEGNITIGENTYMNEHTRIDSGDNSKVVIGRHCAIGRYVHITSKTHDLLQPTTDEVHATIQLKESDVIIGNYVWVGDKVTILPGVHIDDYAVIAAHAVVTRNVNKFEIVGGIPAKLIRLNKLHYKFLSLSEQ